MPTESDLRDALGQLVDSAPQPARFLTDLHRRQRRHQVRFRIAVSSVSVLAAVVLAAVFVLPNSRPDRSLQPAQPLTPIPTSPWPPDSNRWSFSHRVVPPDGWRVTRLLVSPVNEATRLVDTADRNRACLVTFYVAGVDQPPSAKPETLAGRRGVLVPPTAGSSADFWWPQGSDRWASMSCFGMKDPVAAITTLLPRVRGEKQILRVPFTLSTLPTGYSVRTVVQDVESGIGSTVFVADDRREAGAHAVNVTLADRAPDALPGAEAEVTTVGGRPAVLMMAKPFIGKAWLCLEPVAGTAERICGDNQVYDEVGTTGTEDEVRDRLLSVMSRVQPAPDLGDPQTWPSAGRLPG